MINLKMKNIDLYLNYRISKLYLSIEAMLYKMIFIDCYGEWRLYLYERKPKFEIRKASNGQYYFVLKAENGKIIATSEMYETKQGCKNGIESVKKNAPIAEVEDKTE